ncbi:hypothetical protein E2C01_066404 [Portunus trituberculatus]|uniref:Uncharacterized protein n=1 Tax=Portunus trituberculatus TaxID=210409 RepID=A0A5B7HI40_PORTR|nr:hypothetical protein [Portunus trituberculatus]
MAASTARAADSCTRAAAFTTRAGVTCAFRLSTLLLCISRVVQEEGRNLLLLPPWCHCKQWT